jgi:O-antigen/teichoic acid export membrane protein
MSFFGPISPPVLNEANAPIIRTALQRVRVVGKFAFVQAVVQVIGFLSGILLIRYLDQREYAYFTIANTMQGTVNVLADIGISIGLVSIGGRVWNDRHRFGQLVNTALGLRRKLGILAVIGVVPILYFMLLKNGASVNYIAILILSVLAGLGVQLSIGVLSVVPRLRSDIGQIQTIDLTSAVARLAPNAIPKSGSTRAMAATAATA